MASSECEPQPVSMATEASHKKTRKTLIWFDEEGEGVRKATKEGGGTQGEQRREEEHKDRGKETKEEEEANEERKPKKERKERRKCDKLISGQCVGCYGHV